MFFYFTIIVMQTAIMHTAVVWQQFLLLETMYTTKVQTMSAFTCCIGCVEQSATITLTSI